MKRLHFLPLFAAFAMLVLAGCATPERPAGRFLQRENPVVAIVPSANSSPEVSAPIILDKCWEQSLTKWGFTVKNADSVVTYSSSNGIQIADLKNMPTAKLGAELGADYLLFDEVMDWGSSYQVISSKTVVACRSVLIEASTGAVVWKYDWIYIDASGSGGDPIAALVGAAVHSLINSMTDAEARAAEVGVAVTTNTMPYPGFAPVSAPVAKR